MTRPDFGDLYKFIASLGVVLLTLSVLFPWLLLRESFDTSLSATDISKLTPTAQTLIAYRQATALFLTQNLMWISSVLAVVGFTTLAAGIVFWNKRQKELDEELHIRKETKRLQLQQMNGPQIAQKAIQKVAEERGASQVQAPTKSLDSLIQEDQVNKYLVVEATISDRLKQCLGTEFDIITNAKIDAVDFDVVLKSKSPNLEDRIIEIKVSTGRIPKSRVRDAASSLSRAVAVYGQATERRGIGMLFFVAPGSSIQQDLKELQMIFEKEANMQSERMHVFFFQEGEWEKQSCDQIRRWILIDQ